MHILHISNSYGGTNVYTNLYTKLDELGIKQTVYVPLNYKNRSRVGNQMIDFRTPGSRIIYSTILKPWHRVLYKTKINKIVEDIKKKIDIKSIDAIHASTLCVDGAAAYHLFLSDNIPYITAIRNTDINNYFKYYFWYKRFFLRILMNAKKNIFISPKYKEHFVKNYLSSNVSAAIIGKIDTIPNGVSPFFLQNSNQSVKKLGKTIRIVFVSAFMKNKGLLETIKAIDILHQRGYNIELRAIGRGLPNRKVEKKYISKVEKMSEARSWVQLEDFKKPHELCDVFRESDIFVMPSKKETFGLVYVEALTQNNPIIYTKGQGFDGFFEDGFVGYPVEACNELDIADKIQSIIIHYDEISANISNIDLNQYFDWKMIANKYKEIYKQILS